MKRARELARRNPWRGRTTIKARYRQIVKRVQIITSEPMVLDCKPEAEFVAAMRSLFA